MSERPIVGNVLLPEGWHRGEIGIHDGRIASVPGEPADISANDDVLILPGFIDLHVHGGGGADVMDSGAPFETLARMHARHGTTSLLTTTMTAPREELEAVLARLGHYIRRSRPAAT